MKKLVLIVKLSLCFTLATYAQDAPNLQLTGTKPSLTKGTIDTELLTRIIQEKQLEIKQRIFRNIIIKQFNKYKYTERLNNFTTYNYLFNMMDVLTSGKNKTVMTKSMVESSSEFAFVYGLVLYSNKKTIEESKVQFVDATLNRSKTLNTEEIKKFNIRIDMCFDILLEQESDLLKLFNFKESLSNISYKTWYENDNKYLEALKEDNGKDEAKWRKERAELKEKIVAFLEVAGQLKEFSADVNARLIEQPFEDTLEEWLGMLNETTSEDVTVKLDALENDLNTLANSPALKVELQTIKGKIIELKKVYSDNSENLIHILNFYKGLKKSKFEDFALTKEQYYAMKYIVKEFIEQARGQYENNDVVASILDFFLENTLVEFVEYENAQAISITEQRAEAITNDKGYLFVDIESLITSIDANLGSVKNKGLFNYVAPFFSIGTNYGSFINSNTLGTNADGTPSSIDNLYFASEKIGVRVKMYNWKYLRSFKPGEEFNYYLYNGNSWRRPQQEPLISDIHLTAYASGFLYNLVDLKSDKEFDYAILGGGLGVTFFNGLSVNVGLACPISELSLDNSFLNLGLDIPIIEYITALTKSKK